MVLHFAPCVGALARGLGFRKKASNNWQQICQGLISSMRSIQRRQASCNFALLQVLKPESLIKHDPVLHSLRRSDCTA